MKVLVCDIQGFVVCGEFLPKEIAINNGQQISHFLIKPSQDFSPLSQQDKKTARYLERYQHGLKYSKGFVSHHEVPEILNILADADLVYVRGHQKHDFLVKHFRYCPPKIVNLETYDWSPPLPKSSQPICMYHHGKSRICAVTNTSDIFNWIKNFMPD
ncbi:hypothetical protein HHI36_001638 [Cryptolaemus montrouzieri]|uniref:Uncharacterized protein n=1 Tax=Cryptolaemus montrouzieri TaxID=559131 RepID=A0ABD2P871_9CUCU